MFVTNEELKNQIPPEILPDYLGGNAKLNHKAWLIECYKLVTNKASTCSYYYHLSPPSNTSNNKAQTTTTTTNESSATTATTGASSHTTMTSIGKSNAPIMPPPPPSQQAIVTLDSVSGGSGGPNDEFNANRKRQSSSEFVDVDGNENGNKKPIKKQISNYIAEKLEPLPFQD